MCNSSKFKDSFLKYLLFFFSLLDRSIKLNRHLMKRKLLTKMSPVVLKQISSRTKEPEWWWQYWCVHSTRREKLSVWVSVLIERLFEDESNDWSIYLKKCSGERPEDPEGFVIRHHLGGAIKEKRVSRFIEVFDSCIQVWKGGLSGCYEVFSPFRRSDGNTSAFWSHILQSYSS